MGGPPKDPPPGSQTTVPLAPEEAAALRDESTRARGSVPPVFNTGALVAGRYRVIRFIAEGGMGEVYEVEDTQLRERVALKTIRPDRARRDSLALERFKREIALARKVTHPNVCRIFDIGLHQDDALEVPFLSMELLSGETLLQRVRRAGPLTPAEARPIVDQLIAALSAAHRAGIVHRDFKSENVFLVPEPGGDPAASAVRVVVTDFGLARAQTADANASWVTGSAGIVGSPAYMAPEQVEGGEIGAAADQYALGVVMFEMVTGKLPFLAENPLATAARRLKEPAPSPRVHVADLDPMWERAILRCLAREVADRFRSVADLGRALDGDDARTSDTASSVAPETKVPPPPHRGWGGSYHTPQAKRYLTFASFFLIALAALILVRVRPPRPRPAANQVRRAVAVFGFHNLSSRAEDAWLSTALAELLSAELAAGVDLRTIPAEKIARLERDLALARTDTFTPETLARLRPSLDADVVVLGSFTVAPALTGAQPVAMLRVDLRVQDVHTGETLGVISETGRQDDFLAIVSRAAKRLRSRLGAATPSAPDRAAARTSIPANPEAARLYSEGLARLRQLDGLAARDPLLRAAELAPDDPLIHSALADVWSRLGYAAREREAARRAFELSASLPRSDRLAVEARYRRTTGDHARAIEIYRSLVVFYPDDVEHGLRLAGAQIAADRLDDGLATIAALRELPPPAGSDPRIDLLDARAAGRTSDFARAARFAAAATAKGRAQGARLLVAEALLAEAWAARSLGDAAHAAAAAEEATATYRETGEDKNGLAEALDILGGVILDRGEVARALALREEALAIARETGNRTTEASLLENISSMKLVQGDIDGALDLARQSLEIYRLNESRQLAAWAQMRVGSALFQKGDLAGALAAHREAGTLAGEIGDRRALALARYRAGEVLFEQDQLAEARRAQEEALAIREELELGWYLAYSHLALALLALEEGKPQEAVELAGKSAGEYAREGRRDHQAAALSAQARALLALGRSDDARATVAQATRLIEGTQHLEMTFLVPTAAAVVTASSRRHVDVTAALASLDAVIASAGEHGHTVFLLEARLARARIARAARHPGATAALASLAADARAAGFLRIARHAADAR